jgi:hypothetical protein
MLNAHGTATALTCRDLSAVPHGMAKIEELQIAVRHESGFTHRTRHRTRLGSCI